MPGELDDILEKFVPKRLYDELRRDYDRLLIRVGRMEEQLLMLSDYGLETEEDTESIDRRIRRVERARWRRGRAAAAVAEAPRPRPLERDENEGGERRERRGAEERRAKMRERGRESGRRTGGDLDSVLDESLADESTEELIRRLRQRYREISRLRERLRDEEE